MSPKQPRGKSVTWMNGVLMGLVVVLATTTAIALRGRVAVQTPLFKVEPVKDAEMLGRLERELEESRKHAVTLQQRLDQSIALAELPEPLRRADKQASLRRLDEVAASLRRDRSSFYLMLEQIDSYLTSRKVMAPMGATVPEDPEGEVWRMLFNLLAYVGATKPGSVLSGDVLKESIQGFQQVTAGLKADGRLGPKTWGALKARLMEAVETQ